MKYLFLMIPILALIGCGKESHQTELETKNIPKAPRKKLAKAKNPTPTKDNFKPAEKKPIPSGAFVNTLGMPFVPVPGTDIQICIWETRVKDYTAYAAGNQAVDGDWKKPFQDRLKQTGTHPVVNVSWNDAKAFCGWLTKMELEVGKLKVGQRYRLPTDAEWSVAVGLNMETGNSPRKKAKGIKGVYPWGKEWPPPKGVGNYDESLKVDNFEHTSPVGNFAANAHGIHDLGGNVWEWCEDKWRLTSSHRVLRGASWVGFKSELPLGLLLSSNRSIDIPDGRRAWLGFRCVLARE